MRASNRDRGARRSRSSDRRSALASHGFLRHISARCRAAPSRGRSSGVEHNLAKVGVVSSNLIARSRFSYRNRALIAQNARFWDVRARAVAPLPVPRWDEMAVLRCVSSDRVRRLRDDAPRRPAGTLAWPPAPFPACRRGGPGSGDHGRVVALSQKNTPPKTQARPSRPSTGRCGISTTTCSSARPRYRPLKTRTSLRSATLR